MRPPDQVKRDLAKRWIDKAEEDLRAVEYLLASNASVYGVIGFHCQQAVEKWIKAYLTWQSVEFPKTHKIEQLLGIVASTDPSLPPLLQIAVILTDYAVDARYPDEIPDLDLKQAREAFELACRVREIIMQHLPGDFRLKIS